MTTKPESPAAKATDRPVVVQEKVVPTAAIPVSEGESVQLAPATGEPVLLPEGVFQSWACKVTVVPIKLIAVVREPVLLMPVTVMAEGSTCTMPGLVAMVPPVSETPLYGALRVPWSGSNETVPVRPPVIVVTTAGPLEP